MLSVDDQLEEGWKKSSGYSVYDKPIEQSSNDKREYRLLKLDNQLKVLLIHDPEADRASASLDVNIGDSSNPDNLQGLAHFCEHLLFMGSGKYPKVNEYDSYLAKHSGNSNASTSTSCTNYHFDVGFEWLEGALDRFSRFFIDPLFDKNCAENELNAVDSEYKEYQQDDEWRILQVEKLIENPGHTWYLFSIGNMDTLKETPESVGLNVREALLKFYSDNYSANVMNLAVLGRESLDQLTEWVVEKFSDIRNKSVAPPSFINPVNTNKILLTQTFIKPMKNIRRMTLNFPFPVQESLYGTKPSWYICHLINREGSGSLLTFLKKKGWVNEITSIVSPRVFGHDYFSIIIELTEEGLDNYENVLVFVFEYIEMLKKKGVQQWIFDELKTLYDTRFRFISKGSPMNYTIFLSSQMRKNIPLEFIISERSIFREFNPNIIAHHLNELKPDNFRLTIVAQKFPNDLEPTMKEKWFSVDYRVTSISEELIKRIMSISLNPEFDLPTANEFIPRKLSVLKEDILKKSKKPNIIKETETVRIWHKKDDTFWTPKSSVYIKLNSPLIYTTPRNYVMAIIYQSLLHDALAGYIFDANVAGLYNYSSFDQKGILLSFSGYSDKLPLLMEKVIEIMKNFKVNKDRFKVSKSEISRSFSNYFLDSPSYHTEYYLDLALFQRLWSIEDLSREIKDVEAAEIRAFYPTLLHSLHLEALFVGDINKDHAVNLIGKVVSILSPLPLMPSQFIDGRGIKLPVGKHYVFQRAVQNPHETNSAIAYHIPIGYSSNNCLRATLYIFERICEEPCFNQLRTREQLGYTVFSSCCNRKGNLGFEIRITSKYEPVYLENRILEFLQSLRIIIEEMDDVEYRSHVNSIIADKSEKYQSLNEEFIDYWASISDGSYEFDYAASDINHLKSITKANLLDFYDQFISPFSTSSSSLSVHLRSQIPPVITIKDSKISIELIYPVLIHKKICIKSTSNERDIRNTIDEYEKKHGVITESTIQGFLKNCQDKKSIHPINSQISDDIIYKLKNGFSSLSSLDHSKLPDSFIVIDNIIKFKKQMPISASPTPRYTFQYP